MRVAPYAASIGSGAGISFARLRRFWAVAARWNWSRAPHGPRNRVRLDQRRKGRHRRLRGENNASAALTAAWRWTCDWVVSQFEIGPLNKA